MNLVGLMTITVLNLLFTTSLSTSTNDIQTNISATNENHETLLEEFQSNLRSTPKPVLSPHKCSLFPKNKTIIRRIREIDNKMEMIEFMFTFRGHQQLPESVKGRKESRMFKSHFWVRSLGRFSTRLLLLKPNYDVMSFKTLEIRVELFTNVDLEENPKKCLDNLTYDEVENLIRTMILNDFETIETNKTKMQFANRVCNLHIHDADGADFSYYCCGSDRNMDITCTYLEEDVWLLLLRNAIRVLKGICFLFFPLLIPKHFYQTTIHPKPFLLKLKRRKHIIVKRVKGAVGINQEETSIISDAISFMPKFKEKVEAIPLNKEKKFFITEAELEVKDRLVRANDAPVSIFRTLYEHFFNCKLRRLESLTDCCNSTVCRTKVCGLTCTSCERLTWYVFARRFVRFLTTFSLAIPWFIRILVYYRYEDQEATLRKEAAEEKGFAYGFQGNFTLFWSPVHPVFITCYLFLALGGLMLNFMDKYYTKGVRSVVRKCIQETHQQDRGSAFGHVIKILLLPFSTNCWGGLPVGLFMWIYLIPLSLVLLLFTMFPTINLTLNLLSHLIIYAFLCIPAAEEKNDQGTLKKLANSMNRTFTDVRSLLLPNNNSKNNYEGNKEIPSGVNCKKVHQYLWLLVKDLFKGVSLQTAREQQYMKSVSQRLRQSLVILVCLVFLYSCVFLGFEMGTFFVDLFIYTFIGLVMYAEYTATYVSLCVLILLYGKDCFGFVSKQYRSFCSALLDFILDTCKIEARKIYFMKENDQENQALTVHPEVIKISNSLKASLNKSNSDINFEAESFDKLYWRTKQVVFFLTKDDKANIPYKLLFKACSMNYENKPGRLMYQYLKAALQFLVIVGFLLFIGLVVITFGESNKISATNQLMATVAGGILPFIIKNVLLRRNNNYSSNLKEDLNFQVAVYELLEKYNQKWRVYDIDLKEIDEDDKVNNSTGISNDDDDVKLPTKRNGTNDDNSENNIERPEYFADEETLVVFYKDIADNKTNVPIIDINNDKGGSKEAITTC